MTFADYKREQQESLNGCRKVEDIYQFAIEVGRSVIVEPLAQGEEGWELPRLIIYDDYLE